MTNLAQARSQSKNQRNQPNFRIDAKSVSIALAERLEDVLNEFGLDVNYTGKGFTGPCPVHGGDNATGFTIYEGLGNWVCWTKGCHKKYIEDTLGLVRGLLTAKKGQATLHDAIQWSVKFLGKVPDNQSKCRKFEKMVNRLTTETNEQEGVPPLQVRERLITPSPYFLGRGFSPDILNEYLVGDVKDGFVGAMSNRAVASVWSHDGARIIGFTGRTKYLICPKCEKAHPPGPCHPYPKWLHHGFQAGHTLYGYSHALPYIRSQKRVLLVEGPADVWAWRSAGVMEVVGLLRVSLTDPQQVMLEESGAMEVILGLDNDEAGKSSAEEIKTQLSRVFTVKGITADLEWDELPPQTLRDKWSSR